MSKHPYLILIGKRIRELRKARGFSQENFALEADMARSYFSGVERGERNLAAVNLVKIALVLNCEVGDLFPSIKDFKRPGAKRGS